MESDKEQIWPEDRNLEEDVNVTQIVIAPASKCKLTRIKTITIITILTTLNLINYMDRFTIAGKIDLYSSSIFLI